MKISFLLIASHAAAAFALLQLSGCATAPDTVVFITKTSLGIDVESTPPGASIAYDRTEGYIGPRYDNGTVPAIAASFSTNGKLLDRQIKQVYATGRAAKLATGVQGGTTPTETFSGDKKTMFFGTSTVLGTRMSFAPTGLVDSFVLGYKRRELSVIPITDAGVPSVLAMLDSGVQADNAAGAGLQLQQFFATGAAADQIASKGDIQAAFSGDARQALTRYRSHQIEQARLAIETLACLSRVDDAKLPMVWQSAEELSLFDDAQIVPRLRTAAAPRLARSLYTREIAVLDPAAEKKTGLLTGHRVQVCTLAQ